MELLTTEQAAKSLGISVARVKQLLSEGKLKGQHIGKQWIIERSALDEVIVYGKAGRPPKSESTSGEPKSKTPPAKAKQKVK
jgi:excisionase family DNA binding protein